MSSGQFNLTIEDAIILHLLRFTKYRDEFEAPFDVTQPGIADAIGIRRSHVANVLKSLKGKGLIEERTTHVKNTPRKRKTYFPSDEGRAYALKLKSKFEEKKIELVEESGDIRIVKISEINNVLSTGLTLLDIFPLITPEGKIDAARILESNDKPGRIKMRTKERAKRVNYIDDMAQPVRFVGRNDELEKVKLWLESDRVRVIAITGIAGMGKTTLVSRLINDTSPNSISSYYWYKLHEWDNLFGICRNLGDFLSQLGRSKLKFYIECESELDLSSVMSSLEEDLKGLKAILTYDDLQKLQPETIPFFSILTETISKNDYEDVKLITLSRAPVLFYDRRDVSVKNIVAELQLEGLDRNSSKHIFDPKAMDDESFKEIYRVTGGHPLSLELINLQISSGDDANAPLELMELFKGEHDLNKYLREEILLNLLPIEKKILEFMSVLRYPVSTEALFIDDEIEFDSIESLLSKALLHETMTGYDVHELIREFFYQRLNTTRRSKYHGEAAKYYKTVLDESHGLADIEKELRINAIIESQHHNICAKNPGDAACLAAAHGDELIRRGYAGELHSILDKVISGDLAHELKSELLVHKGTILTIDGDWDSALGCYTDSLRLCEDSGDDIGMARAFNAIGAIYYRKGDWERALDHFNKGLELAEANSDDVNCSKLYSNIALVHWSMGKLDDARSLMEKGLKLSEKLEDLQGIARVYNNLGIIHWEQKELDKALDAYEKSLELSEQLDDKRTMAILYGNMGEVFRMNGAMDKAEDNYKRSLEVSNELGFKWQVAEVYTNMGEMYRVTDESQSKEYLTRALELYEVLGAKKQIEKVNEILKH